MFPIAPAAKKYKMGETKVKYTIQFGISPYIKSIILKDVQNKPFSFKFDESTTSQTKKQYDGYITYYSSVLGKVITIYLGSLFVNYVDPVVENSACDLSEPGTSSNRINDYVGYL